MTSEQRLDRLERIAKLFASAGLRARRDIHQIDEKLNILISNQIRSDEKFDEKFERLVGAQTKLAEAQASLTEAQASLTEAQALSDRKIARLAEAQASLAEAQALSDRKFAELIDIIRKGRNGNRSARNN